MKFSPLQKKLLPEINSMSSDELAKIFSPLRKNYIVENIVDTDRFVSRTVQLCLTQENIRLVDQSEPFAKEHILQAIMRIPLNSILQSIGLCLNANALAQACLENGHTSPSKLSRFSAEEIKFALQFRNRSSVEEHMLGSFEEIIDDGLRCFQVWISDIPVDMQNLLGYYCGRHGFSFPDIGKISPSNRRRYLDCCEKWCDAKLITTSDEGIEEDESESA